MEFKEDNGIGIINLHGGDTHTGNPLSSVADDFADACSEIAADKRFKVLVILFMESSAAMSETSFGGSSEGIGVYGRAVEAIAGLDIPTLIGMEGYIPGQVLELALACDIRYATLESFFGFPEIEAGFMPCAGGTQRLPRLIGRAKALEMILTGSLVDSKSALEIGLINKILKHDDLYSGMMSIAQEMSSKSPTSLIYTKEAINEGMELSLEQGMRLESDLYFLMHTTHDRREGILAFQEKRKALFTGE